jgi:hypothetical protein
LAKINPTAGLMYSYPIPGLDGRIVVAVDAQGNVYFAAIDRIIKGWEGKPKLEPITVENAVKKYYEDCEARRLPAAMESACDGNSYRRFPA